MPRYGETDKHTVRSAVRYLQKCCADFGNSDSGCDQSRVYVWENLKYLIKPRDFKDRTHRFLQAGQRELAAISFDLLHSLDKCSQTSTIDIGYARKIDNQPFRFFLDQNIRLIFCQLVVTPRAGRDGDSARTKRLATGDIARGIANYVDLGCGEFAAMLFLCASASESSEPISILMIIGKRAEFKEMPDAIMLEL